MNKKLIIVILIFLLIIVIKYTFSNYSLIYKVNNYDVYTKYNKGRYYFEIKKEHKYNFDIYGKRGLSKVIISDIKEIQFDNYDCILPVIKNMETYPLCYSNNDNQLIDYHLIDDEVLAEYKSEIKEIEKPNKDFIFYNNLNSNEYVALWTYKGYTIMNGKEYNDIKLFKNDRYDNDLAYLINDTIYMPNYDQEHEFDTLIALNLVSQKTHSIKLDKKIDYDSYIVGNIKKKLYIFDNKASILYEINIRNGETKILSSAEKGYVKYDNGKFVTCSKSEYKVNKVTIDSEKQSIYDYKIDKNVIKTFNDNKELNTLIINAPILIVKENKNSLYYIKDNNFYKYNPNNGEIKVFYDYELSFNNSKAVFMYMK